MIDPVNNGAIAFHIVIAGVLTLVVGVLLLLLYRRAVSRWMATSARAQRSDVVTGLVGSPPARPLHLVSAKRGRGPICSPALCGASTALRHAAVVYTLAGIAFALTATSLQVLLGSFAFAPVRYAAVACANAWPVLMMLALFWGPDRRRQLATVAVYAGVLGLIALTVAVGDTPPLPLGSIPALANPAPGTEAMSAVLTRATLPAFAQPLFVWLLFALPTAYLLLFLNRRLRAIGPVLLVAMLVGSAGVLLATVFMGSHAGMTTFGWVYDRIGIGGLVWFYGLQVAAFLLFLLPGWLAIAWLARRYNRKRTSDQTLVFDAIWLFATLLLCQSLAYDAGLLAWSGLLAFAVYKLITRLGLAPLARAARNRPPARLLLLRVFGHQRRTERFFAILSARWRYAGSIQLIAASDLATATIEPGEFLDFLSGRLRRLFIHNRGDLERRLAQMDTAPDPDGRFRINEFFCTEDTWRDAATRLMGSSHFVVMDLRGFSATNKGCIFELQALLDGVSLSRLILLIDRTTDRPMLEDTLRTCWQRIAAQSPNRINGDSGEGGEGGIARLQLLPTQGNGAHAVQSLLRLADAALSADRTPPETARA